MHIFNAGGSARWGPVPFMKKKSTNPKAVDIFSFRFLKKGNGG